MPDEPERITQKILEGFTFSAQTYRFTANDYARIAAALGVEALDDAQRASLQSEGDRFTFLAQSWGKAPRPAQIRKILKAVHTDTKRLMNTIRNLYSSDDEEQLPAQEVAQNLIHLQAPENDWALEDTDFVKFTGALCQFGVATKKALDNLPDNSTGGRTLDLPLRIAVGRLAQIFTGFTRHKATVTVKDSADPDQQYGGRFYRFVEAFLSPIPAYRRRSNVALGKAIERILRDRRTD